MQLDAAASATRAARRLRFAASDANVAFRKPAPATSGAIVDLDDGVLRGKRLSWTAFYGLLPDDATVQATVMVEVAPCSYINEATATRLGIIVNAANRYQVDAPVKLPVTRRVIMPVTPPRKAANDNRTKPARTAAERAAGRAQAEASRIATANAIARHADDMTALRAPCSKPSTPSRILNALQKYDTKIAQQFCDLRELLRPPVIAANDNFAPVEDERDRNWGLERKHNQGNIRPSPEELLAAHEAGFAHGVTYHKAGDPPATRIGGIVSKKFIGLQIGHGEGQPLFYGDKRGRKKKARYEPGALTKPELFKDEREVQAAYDAFALQAYIGLKNRTPVQGCLSERYRIGSRMRLSRYTKGVAHKYGQLGGIIALKETATPSRPLELSELDRAVDAADFMGKLDTTTRRVIDTMLVADNFNEVAVAVGKEPTSHNGKRLVVSALQTFSEKFAA